MTRPMRKISLSLCLLLVLPLATSLAKESQKNADTKEATKTPALTWIALNQLPRFKKSISTRLGKAPLWFLGKLNKDSQLEGEFAIFNNDGEVRVVGRVDEKQKLDGLLLEFPFESWQGKLRARFFEKGQLLSEVQYDRYEYESASKSRYRTTRPQLFRRYLADARRFETYRVHPEAGSRKLAQNDILLADYKLRFTEDELKALNAKKPRIQRPLNQGELADYQEEFMNASKYASQSFSVPFMFYKNGPKTDLQGKALTSPFENETDFWLGSVKSFLKLTYTNKPSVTLLETPKTEVPTEEKATEEKAMEENKKPEAQVSEEEQAPVQQESSLQVRPVENNGKVSNLLTPQGQMLLQADSE